MALEEITIDLSAVELTGGMKSFLAEAEKRVDEFFADEGHRRYPRYLPSEFIVAHDIIAAVQQQGLCEGNVFCEWGSGFGVAACFAAMMGFESYGIEIESELVDISQKLANDFDLPVEFACTSFIPEGLGVYRTPDGESAMLTKDVYLLTERRSAPEPAYEKFDLAPDEVDLVYVYPWPGELDMVTDLFDAVSCDGALLAMYQGPEELYLYQKV